MQKHASLIIFSYIFWLFLFIVDHDLAKKKLFLMNKNKNVYSYFYFILGNLELNDSCGLTGQCIQPFSVCFKGTCKCMDVLLLFFFALDKDSCFKGF